MKKIQVGFLFSYDYEKLKISIPLVYDDADAIFIAVDEEYRTWSGEVFKVEDQFFEWLNQYDSQKKITIYRDNFYVPELSAIENDNRERHRLSLKMGIGNWLIQVDSDEYFIDFKKLINLFTKGSLLIFFLIEIGIKLLLNLSPYYKPNALKRQMK